jgi:lipopolysaccharide/colanic/teichoic acid biosynthesis glycosyltransferase
LLIVFSPFLIIIPPLIKLTSPGPVFADIPKRVGKGGKLFRMYKFRSMICNAHDLLLNDPKFRKLHEEYKKGSYKLKDDPRITRVGKFIRRFSIDELPQVFNVLRGEMSMVGPRAYFPDELENQQKVYPGTKKYVKELLKAKPGLTGNWQVSGRSEVNFDKRVEMDADYVSGKSVWQDIIIILKTPWAMLSGKGAL